MAIIVADIGSCHGNDKAYFERAIAVARGLGVQLKVQLFGPDQAVGGNVHLHTLVYREASEIAAKRGVPMFSSVWTYGDYVAANDVANEYGTSTIKFAYSQRNNLLIKSALDEFETVYVSSQHLDLRDDDPPNMKRLLCIPQYPVYGAMCFEECFPPFYGFSDHTLGKEESFMAIANGAKLIEKHVKFKGYHDCPDAKFALDEAGLERLAKYVN